jgi:hypothetical protein
MRIVKILLGLVGLPALAGGGWYGYMRYQRKVAADAALAPLAAPYLASGWKTFSRPIWKSRHKAEAMIGANTCVIAIASTSPGSGKFVVERGGGGNLEGETSLAYCTCNDEKVVVHTQGNAPGGVQILYQEAVAVGGSSALPMLSPPPKSLPATAACPVDPLDAWLAAGKRSVPPSSAGLAVATKEALESHGWALAASAPSEVPFAVVPGAKESCFLATSTQAGEALTLRDVGGERPLHSVAGSTLAIGWCTHSLRPVTVWRTGAGAIVVYKTDATKLGGTLGLRENASGYGLGDVPTWVPASERGWDASGPLLLSGVPQADISFPTDGRALSQMRLVSLMLGSGHIAPVPDEKDRYLCVPPLDKNPSDALCVQSTGLGWKAAPGDPPGVAESPLPFWMDVMTQVEDHAGLVIEQQLLTLSRRLAAQHYEPTARAGVSEEKDGIEVAGRDGDDKVIAIGVLSTAPWVLPYSDGDAWSLDGEPHAVPIKPGEHLHLVAKLVAPPDDAKARPPVKIPPDLRHTVVFRHHT